MGAWGKLFGNRNIVSSTVSVKGADGVTRSAKLVVGAAGLSDADFAEAAKSGATLSESRKDVNAAGEPVAKKNTIRAGDITMKQAADAVGDLLGVTDPVPAPTRKRADGVPLENGNGKHEPAKS